MSALPVARPRMPALDALRPWLERIDANRSYSNFGPLTRELEQRLASRLGVDAACVTTVANGTTGLILALQGLTEGRAGLCLMPSWTFVATAHAVVAAGLTPCLLDVDAESWALTPAIALDALARMEAPVAAVLPVAPFGAPMDMGGWDRFTALTGIPVLVDAAAAHDTVQAARTPAVVSLHATKILGAGEGGYVVCHDPDLIVAIRRRSNFGFYGARNAEVTAINGKMSEYHAAVGLAAMDAYAADIARFRHVAMAYREGLAARPDIRLQPGFGLDWCGSACVARFIGGDAARVAARLASAGIDSRAWWGEGVHAQSAFADLQRRPLPVTGRLAHETLGLPFFVDMDAADVARVCAAILSGTDAAAPVVERAA